MGGGLGASGDETPGSGGFFQIGFKGRLLGLMDKARAKATKQG